MSRRTLLAASIASALCFLVGYGLGAGRRAEVERALIAELMEYELAQTPDRVPSPSQAE